MASKLRVGVDFGTTNTTVAYFDEGKNLQFFQYTRLKGPYIPTVIFYEKGSDEYTIGFSAMEDHGREEGTYLEHFKMFLPHTPEEYRAVIGAENALDLLPVDITRHFLSRLLEKFKQEKGDIDFVVCSVPELWQNEASNLGNIYLKDIITEDLGLSNSYLSSEPVCAAAYFSYLRQKSEPFEGNLLVCDMGGGTFDVSLCKLGDRKIEVLTFFGHGVSGLEFAGVGFDRRSTRLAYEAAEQGKAYSLLENFERRKLEHAFEMEKMSESVQRGVKKNLKKIDEGKKILLEAPAYKFNDKYLLTFDQMQTALAPVIEGINDTLKKIKEWIRTHDEPFKELIIVGGFGQHPVVQQTILKALDWQSPLDEEYHSENNIFYSVAAGAAVIANEFVTVVERYPHTLGFKSNKIVDGEHKDVNMPIVKAGESIIDGSITWAKLKPKTPLEVKVLETGVNIPFWLQLHGKGKRIAFDFNVSTPELGSYEVGVQIDKNYQAQILFKQTRTKDGEEIKEADVIAIPLGKRIALGTIIE